MSTDTVADWLALVDAAYPLREAAEWDNVGLQIGDPAWIVSRVLVALDVTAEVIDEAAQVDGTLVVAHHPLLFRGLERLAPDTAAGRLALHAATLRVPIIAAHTNLD
ncbi:MAG: Nif3-like dinuclear metal center hexameric protein, partial [Nitriliruptoraceae bacterium]